MILLILKKNLKFSIFKKKHNDLKNQLLVNKNISNVTYKIISRGKNICNRNGFAPSLNKGGIIVLLFIYLLQSWIRGRAWFVERLDCL